MSQEQQDELRNKRRGVHTDLDLSGKGLTTLPDWVGDLPYLHVLNLSNNKLTTLPGFLARLTRLRYLNLSRNIFRTMSGPLSQLSQLLRLDLSKNQLGSLPSSITQLTHLQRLDLSDNQLTTIPSFIAQLPELEELRLSGNRLTALPSSLVQLAKLRLVTLDNNPLTPELLAAYTNGLDAMMAFLRATIGPQVILNEAKLILIGEGEVGKTCLLAALRGDDWIEGRPTTHGIEIKSFTAIDSQTGTEIKLNGWDFGGQRVYRPTHQLFFSAPAVYLVVWKPREGIQQGLVKEWIKLVLHREPDAKILVVATHGLSGQRQPDLDRQEIWDLFGRDTVIDFVLVDSKPDKQTNEPFGIRELKKAIANIATSLPGVGRSVPARWQNAKKELEVTRAAYVSLNDVLEICSNQQMEEEEARLFVNLSHTMGHLIHYEHDPALCDIVVLKPDWLATAISFVLEDTQIRDANGLVDFARLRQIWDDPERELKFRYPASVHFVFLRLMERFDLSYRVPPSPDANQEQVLSLIAQLVPDIRPRLDNQWPLTKARGEEQQVQICRVVEAKSGRRSIAEGLFYQLIVRLHKYSLGRTNAEASVHWRRGLLLDDDWNGRALLEMADSDVRITVRAPYPERFLSVLTSEVKWLVDNFWSGLRCKVMVPCTEPCGQKAPGTGLFDVQKLIESKKDERLDYPCSVCGSWQNIDLLLRNSAPDGRIPVDELLGSMEEVKRELNAVRGQLVEHHRNTAGQLERLDVNTKRILSKVDDSFTGLMQALTDEAKDGPRLFSFEPADTKFLDRPKWVSEKFRLTLWCEHSRLPLPSLNGSGDQQGVYELYLSREWFKEAAPFFKVLTGTLSLMLPVAASASRLLLNVDEYKKIETELDFGQKSIQSVIKGAEQAEDWLKAGATAPDLGRGDAIRAQGRILRQLHSFLREKDPGFGGLVRVRNKRQEFLWVHKSFEKEY